MWTLLAVLTMIGAGSAGAPPAHAQPAQTAQTAQPAAPAAPAASLTLDQAVAEALDHNLGLLAERYGVSIAAAGVITARLRPNPVFSMEADHLDWLGTNYDKVNNAGPSEYSVRTDVPIERGGKRERRIAVAQEGQAMADAHVLDAARTVILDVQQAFVELQLANDNVTLAQQNYDALNEIARLNQERVRAGDLAEVESLRSRLASLQSQQDLRQAQLKQRTARRKLQVVIGRTRQVDTFDIIAIALPPPPALTADALRAKALATRPDLEMLRRSDAKSLADLRLQLAMGTVDYTLGAEYRRQQGLAGKGNSVGVFFSANLPLFNRNQGEIARAQREHDQIVARITELETTIAADVEDARQQFETAKATLATIEGEMLQQAREVRAATEYAYKRGDATFIEFLDAQRAFNDTMQAYNEGRAEYARSVFIMQSAIGDRTF
jgi:cobalt-zinc-cadmium efflux system outer membrane protein